MRQSEMCHPVTGSQGFPEWLRRSLVEAGVLTAQGLSRRAKPMLHRRCGALVVAGFDRDSCAFDAWCDPRPLTADGELAALLDGRRTCDLEGGRLYVRDRYTIPGRPPSPTRTVLAEHRCHAPVPDDWTLPPAPPAPTLRTEF